MLTELGDAILVGRACDGDAEAFGELARRHVRGAYAATFAICRDETQAEDVVLDALLRALQRIEQCRDTERFGAWLHQIVRRRAFDVRESARRRHAEPLDTSQRASPGDAGTDLERAQLRDRLLAAMEQLTPMQRTVLILFDPDDWSHKQIADKLGCSVGMSTQHLFAARRAMRRLLGDSHDA